MKPSSDVIVVGGGPCGSFTALNLAKRGVNVRVLEEHAEIGVPPHCAGHLSIGGLKSLGLYPLPSKIVENTFCGAIFYSPSGKKFSIRLPSPVTCVVNRALFDTHVAEMAKDVGARFSLNSSVDSVTIEKDFVKGVVDRRGKTKERFSTKVLVDAEGISSKILKQAGLSGLDHHMLVIAVQAEAENVEDLKTDMVEVFLGKDYAPGLYAWLIPKLDGRANVGLATNVGNPKRLLRKLMHEHPTASKKLHSAKLSHITMRPLSLGGSLPRTYSKGFLVVGDAASQVKPTTGGGVIFGMTCARVAAAVIRKALHKNDFSPETLGEYQERCDQILAFDLKIMLKTRKMLNALSDEKLDRIIGFCTRIGLDKTLQNVRDLDFQGRSLMSMLLNPRFSLALLYFLSLYLWTKPKIPEHETEHS